MNELRFKAELCDKCRLEHKISPHARSKLTQGIKALPQSYIDMKHDLQPSGSH